MEQKDIPESGASSELEDLTNDANVPSASQDSSYSTPDPTVADAYKQPAMDAENAPSLAPVHPGMNDQQPVAAVSMMPVAIGEQPPHHANFDSTKKFTKGIVRTVIGHTLAIAIVGLGGWFLWQWSGIFGVHYKEVGRPYLAMQQSLSQVSFALIDSYPHAVYESSSSSALATSTDYKTLTENVAEFDKTTTELKSFKAFKQGEVSNSLQTIAGKNKHYSDYVKARAQAYKVVQGALDICGHTTYTDQDVLERHAKCKQHLATIKDADIPDGQFKTFFAGYKTYVGAASDLATAYVGKTRTWSDVFKAWNNNDNTLRELISATRIKIDSEEKKLNPREEIAATADKLADLIEEEKGSQH